MRTSYKQFSIMMDFMEQNGDLSRIIGGPKGRYYCTQKWTELAQKLNEEGSGDARPEEKWRKVWSDFKNNTKKKLLRITKASPTYSVPRAGLTELEQRVMALAKKDQLTTEEGSGEEDNDTNSYFPVKISKTFTDSSDLNNPGTSRGSTSTPLRFNLIQPKEILITAEPQDNPTPRASTPITPSRSPSPYQSRRSSGCRTNRFTSKANRHSKALLEIVRNAANAEKERDKMSLEMERERIRQRDVELQLQAQWLIFMKEALSVFKTFVERKSSEK